MNIEQQERLNEVTTRVCRAINIITSERRIVGSQKEFAELIELSTSKIRQWENMQAFPSLDNIIRMCQVFNISPDYLILGHGSTFGNPEIIAKIKAIEKRIIAIENFIDIPR